MQNTVPTTDTLGDLCVLRDEINAMLGTGELPAGVVPAVAMAVGNLDHALGKLRAARPAEDDDYWAPEPIENEAAAEWLAAQG